MCTYIYVACVSIFHPKSITTDCEHHHCHCHIITIMDDEENGKSPIKRLGSTRKLLMFNSIRHQLTEQLRHLDTRMEANIALIIELQDFYRKRAEVELEYSKNLDKMAKSVQMKQKEYKQKREMPIFSSYECYLQLVHETKSISKNHATISEIYNTHLVNRLSQVQDDMTRIYKLSKEVAYEIYEDILKVFHKSRACMKEYQRYAMELQQAETKLLMAEKTKSKLETNTDNYEKVLRSRKYKLLEKEINKRKDKVHEVKLKMLKSKNEYISSIEASNAIIQKYFTKDVYEIFDCMDFGFTFHIQRVFLMHVTAVEGKLEASRFVNKQLRACVENLNAKKDRQKIVEQFSAAFMLPKKLNLDVEESKPESQKLLQQELEARVKQINEKVANIQIETSEVLKTLEAAEANLLKMQTAEDYDCSVYFGQAAVSTQLPLPSDISASARHETEDFYLAKFKEYISMTSKKSRLKARENYFRSVLNIPASPNPSISSLKQKQPRRKQIGRLQLSTQTKLFGGSLEEYLENTKEEIPLIMRSCIRIINLYGMQHQGIFRVSGSQLEINHFKESFERGEDPLVDVTDAADINSVAGVLKLYLRELKEPLFPLIYFDELINITKSQSHNEIVSKLKELIATLPRRIIVVMRYLFAFLNHLADFSDENMMDYHNIAICFGPTLVSLPDNYKSNPDQITKQNEINEVIKYFIKYSEEIFPNVSSSVRYEKYITEELDDADVEELQEEPDTEFGSSKQSLCNSEEEINETTDNVTQEYMIRQQKKISASIKIDESELSTYVPFVNFLDPPYISSDPPEKADDNTSGVMSNVSHISSLAQPCTSREARNAHFFQL